jgi:hypothetical protein
LPSRLTGMAVSGGNRASCGFRPLDCQGLGGPLRTDSRAILFVTSHA